ncbi:LptA/OstA family protein [Zavarzinia sp. CC-PAN008]|uniref:LptA/OstA family protein n=1 Tax=Zavarzinia sp. CC-PAN008 TaxID=3243332 RepID=UPI003F743CEE
MSLSHRMPGRAVLGAMAVSLGVSLAPAFAALLAPAPATAQALGLAADQDQPISINADSLDVDQKAKVATFRGNVLAVQGETRLKASEVRVHYDGAGTTEADAPTAPPPPATDNGGVPAGTLGAPAAAAGAGGGRISRIEAAGGVFVSTPTQTAEGDDALYDLRRKQITLTGKVVLTQGENVLRGSKLVVDLATDRTTLTAGGSGRVQGLFVPGQSPGQGQQGSQPGTPRQGSGVAPTRLVPPPGQPRPATPE